MSAQSLILCALWALAACSDSAMDSKSNINNSNSHTPMLRIVIDSSTSPEVGDTAELHAEVDNVKVYAPISFRWTVSGPLGGEVSLEDDSSKSISFLLDDDGTYVIDCTAEIEGAAPVSTNASLIVSPIGAEELVYTVQITPPPTSGAPPSEDVVIVEGVDKSQLTWQVKEGIPVALVVTDESETPLPTFVRLYQSNVELPRDLYLDDGAKEVRINGTVDALFVPDSDAVAPLLKTGMSAGSLWTVQIDGGVLLQGTVSGAGPTSMAGALVTLYTAASGNGRLAIPSTVGVVGSDGRFALRGRPGRVSMTVVPKEPTAPIAVIEASIEADLMLDAQETGDWAIAFAPPPTIKLTASVVRADGKSARAGAMVVLQADDLGEVGTLQIGDESWVARGRYRRVLATNDAGQLVDPADQNETIELPRGTYEAVVVPATDEEQAQGRRVSTLVLENDMVAKLSFAERVTVEGEVRGFDGAAVRARITAKEIDDLDAVTVDTDEAGRFTLHLDDGMTYAVVFRSLSNLKLAPLLTRLTVKGHTTLTDLVLPRAVRLSGTIETTGGLAVPNTLLRIWCSDRKCPSRNIVDETQTDSAGGFVLRIPPPNAGVN